jgi:hypothetical protein
MEGKIEGTGKQGRRCKQLLDGLKEMRGYCKLKEETLGRTVWRTRSGRGYGLIRRQATELMPASTPQPSPSQSTFLQSLIFMTSYLYPISLASGWLMAVHPVDIFLRQSKWIVRNALFLWLGKSRDIKRPEPNSTRHRDRALQNPIKSKLSRGKKTWRLPASVFHGVKGSLAGFKWFRERASVCLLWTGSLFSGLRSALSCVLTQREVVIPYRIFTVAPSILTHWIFYSSDQCTTYKH